MRERFIAIFLLLVVGLLPSVAYGQSCSELMKFGIYDHYNVLASREQFRLMQSYVRQADSGASGGDSSLNTSATVPVEGIPLAMGFNKSDSNYNNWVNQFESMTYDEARDNQLLIQEIRTISPALMDVVKHCIDSQQSGFSNWIETSQDRTTFSYMARYRPNGSEQATVKSFDILPHTVKQACEHESSFQNFNSGREINSATVALSCPVTPETTVTVTLVTDKGGHPVTLDGLAQEDKDHPEKYTVDARANSTANQWFNTGQEFPVGTELTITATGHACLDVSGGCSGPEGSELFYGGCKDIGMKCGALYGKIGDSGTPFFVGSSYHARTTSAGILFLGYADVNWDTNIGSYTVYVTAKPSEASSPKPNKKIRR
jgi:hypothetical protein